jgi:glycosyltransferase involved in cell wall biosynthesis/polysaccharide pyruvyl transferase WcaK-like protein
LTEKHTIGKVGIVTLLGNYNYGNRLQNYALEYTLRQLNFEVETLHIPVQPRVQYSWGERLLRKVKNPKELISAIQKRVSAGDKTIKVRNELFMKMCEAKEEILSPFTETYLSNFEIDLQNLTQDDYRYFITGSDQVWNPDFIGFHEHFFLTFAPREKRISYAASFGIPEIPPEYAEHFKKMLQGMDKISVREEAGIEIVRTLTGREAKLTVDPTMLLSKSEWQDLIRTQKTSAVPQDEKFILIYMLREYAENKQRQVCDFAAKCGYKVIQVMGDLYDESHVIYNPIEFIEAIAKAEMVFSDSFHCGVFAIIMNTPFVIFEREGGNMGSRLQTLLNRFDLPGNLHHEGMSFEERRNNTDFSQVESVLTKGREEGMAFLKEALVTAGGTDLCKQAEMISVIVPIYKVEPYLRRCVDSLLAQTYPDLELILVDDGSPDQCGAICDEYKLIHGDRMKVIHKKNGGVAEARNAGIEAANGNYLAFVDPDDFIHPRMLEILYENLKAADADISVCDYKKIYDNTNLSEETVREEENLTTIYSGEQALWNLYDEKLNVATVIMCNKLFKTELFKDIRFPVGRNMEDEAVIHQILYRSRIVVYTQAVLYFYCIREDSITGTYVKNYCDILAYSDERMIFFQKHGLKALFDAACKGHLSLIIRLYMRVAYLSPNDSNVLKELKKSFRWGYLQIKENGKAMPIRFKLFFYLPKVYCFLRKYVWRRSISIKTR